MPQVRVGVYSLPAIHEVLLTGANGAGATLRVIARAGLLWPAYRRPSTARPMHRAPGDSGPRTAARDPLPTHRTDHAPHAKVRAPVPAPSTPLRARDTVHETPCTRHRARSIALQSPLAGARRLLLACWTGDLKAGVAGRRRRRASRAGGADRRRKRVAGRKRETRGRQSREVAPPSPRPKRDEGHSVTASSREVVRMSDAVMVETPT